MPGTALACLLLALTVRTALGGAAIGVQAAVDRQRVYVGEPFILHVQVQGSDKPEAPDVSGLTDFAVEALGGRPQNSEMTTIINGRRSHVVRRAYLFGYRLTPRKAGRLTIPALSVTVEGGTHATAPIIIQVQEPKETDDLKLRMSLSKSTCTVGEPVILTVTWYLAKNVRNIAFSVPVLASDAFGLDDVQQTPDRTRRRVRIPVGREDVFGEEGKGTLEGHSFTTVAFRKVLIPRKTGTFAIPRATVSCEMVVGYSRTRDFFGDRRPVYDRFVVPSNEPTLEVRPLPSEGQPEGFAGHVGTYRIAARATPTEVNVGDPITLTVRVSGPAYLKSVELPPLQQQAVLARDFRIPSERAEGKIEGDAKVFTQTIRALRPDVEAIPAIELPYFDSEAGEYRIARSEPIRLTVRKTRIVTASDAEGREMAPVQTELQALQEGIVANYEDLSVLDNQDFGLTTVLASPLWMLVLGLPPIAYLALLTGTVAVRRRRADPEAVEARRAASILARELKALPPADADVAGQVLAALRGYLGRKLRLPAAAITFADAAPHLREAGIADEQIAALEALFRECEAGRYAGAASDSDEPLPLRALALARELERRLP